MSINGGRNQDNNNNNNAKNPFGVGQYFFAILDVSLKSRNPAGRAREVKRALENTLFEMEMFPSLENLKNSERYQAMSQIPHTIIIFNANRELVGVLDQQERPTFFKNPIDEIISELQRIGRLNSKESIEAYCRESNIPFPTESGLENQKKTVALNFVRTLKPISPEHIHKLKATIKDSNIEDLKYLRETKFLGLFSTQKSTLDECIEILSKKLQNYQPPELNK